MAKLASNSKYVELEDVRVYMNPATGNIELISGDHDLRGKPFKITLAKGSETEATLREIIIAQGIRKSSHESALPRYLAMPAPTLYPKDPFSIPIGLKVTAESEELTEVSLDLKVNPHTFIIGRPGSGKTNTLAAMIRFVQAQGKAWETYLVDPSKNHPELVSSEGDDHYASSLHEAYSLVRALYSEYTNRISPRPSEASPHENTPILFVIDDFSMFKLTPHLNATQKALVEDIRFRLGQMMERSAGLVNIFIVVADQSGEHVNVFDNQLVKVSKIAFGSISPTECHNFFGRAGYTPAQPVAGRAIIADSQAHNETIFQAYEAKPVNVALRHLVR